MSDKSETKDEAPGRPTFTDVEMAKARQWFKKGEDCRQRREYDYAIECFITGLNFWTEAVDEGHKPLHALAVQRLQTGGKKAGMMEALKKPMSGKNAKQCLLNAEYLWAKDPFNGGYLDGLLKNASRADFHQTLQWITPLVMESMRKDKKPSAGRFKTFRDTLAGAAAVSDERGDTTMAAWLYEQAVATLEFLLARNPTDMKLRDEQRDLSGRLTIARGKYADADSFRDSLQDGDKQKLLHDSERVKQGEQTLDDLIAAAREQLQAHPTVPSKINALIDALLKREQKKEETEAIDVLTAAYQESENYSFKLRADDVRLRQLRRQTRQLKELARQSGAEADQQQLRLAELEERQIELEISRERAAKYPTDLRIKYRLGAALFRAGEYDEAIPMLQDAQADPRSRTRCLLLIGQAFFEKQTYFQACEVLKGALDAYEIPGDDTAKELMWRLGRAYEADQKPEDAKSMYGKLLRMEYNYANGEARKRLESLK